MTRIIELKDRLLKSSLFKDSFWALFGNILGKGLALLASIFVARYLGKDIFGMYGLIRTTLLSVAVFSTFGLGYTATKFIAEYMDKSPEKIRSIIKDITNITLITGILFAIIIFIFSKQLASYLHTPELYQAIRYLAVIIIFNSITTAQTGILAGFKKFKQLARINLFNGIVTFVLSVTLTYFFSLDGALIALLLSQMYNCLQNEIEVRKSLKLVEDRQQKVSIKKELVLFSLPVALQEMLYSITTWILPILLVKYSNIGEVGLYNAANQWSSVILFLPGALRNVIFAHLSSETDNQNAQRVIINRMLLVNFVSTFIPCLIIWLFSGFITKIYGDSFQALKHVLNVSVFATIFTCMSTVLIQYLLSSSRVWLAFIIKVLSVAFLVGAFILLNYFWNLNGAVTLAVAFLIKTIVFFVILYVYFKHKTNLQ